MRSCPPRRRWTPAVLAGLVLLAGCSGKSPSMLHAKGPESKDIAGVWWLMFVLAAVVYVVVAVMIVVGVVRGRGTEDGKPSKLRDDALIWIGGIVIPVVILGVMAVVTVTTTRSVRQPSAQALRIDVTGKDWWWAVDYPASGVTTANEIHVPVGRPLDVTLTSADVIHSFWVPQLAGKMDLVPGQPNHLRFRADSAGTYRGECAEYCGLQHARMDFLVVAEPPADFDRWLARRTVEAGVAPASEQAALGEVVFNREACAGCHTIRGTQAAGKVGPDLTDFGSRQTIGAATVANTPANLERWITDSQSIKRGNVMPPFSLSPADLNAVIAYLESLK